MTVEPYFFRVDIKQIIDEIQTFIKEKEFVPVYKGYGGWSVTSATGSYTEGWNTSAMVVDEIANEMNIEETRKNFLKLGLKRDVDHIVPTELCSPSIQVILDEFYKLGLNPCRARLHCLKAHSEIFWHKDAPSDAYAVRTAIPLITNSGCFFETENESVHLPVGDYIYFMKVNVLHRVINKGDTDRLHLVISVRDTKGITLHHRFKGESNET